MQQQPETGLPLAIEIFSNFEDARDVWCAFQREATGGAHDTWEWNDAWARTAGKADEPLIVAGRDRSGDILFLLPLAIRRRTGCKVLEWFAAEQGNYASGLFRPQAWSGPAMPRGKALLRHVVAALPPVDVVHLEAQPSSFSDSGNPLAGLPGVEAASPGHAFPIGPDWKSMYETRRSPRSRRAENRKERRLEEHGPVRMRRIDDPEARLATLETIFRQKQVWFAERGIPDPFADSELRRFFGALARTPDNADGMRVVVHELTAGDEVVAASLDVVYRNCFYALVSSTTNGELRKCGPGTILFHRLVEQLAASNIELFDFGAGENELKRRWSTLRRDLYHGIVPLSAKGRVYATALSGALTAKRIVKRSPQAWYIVQRARQWKSALVKPAIAAGVADAASVLLIHA